MGFSAVLGDHHRCRRRRLVVQPVGRRVGIEVAVVVVVVVVVVVAVAVVGKDQREFSSPGAVTRER